ncbi:nucleolar and coiled-body phosphoprotein 1-like [Xiphophorus couchianus]|uniref:nucleolar and coiled-body phosphoprotein 1-like n=1 Tax=Xiphophorus couchianus TaxID=32473 RepID=UPI001016307D|nr:nucleolar and coiled-body phosphoprotein 1-like [Xiphophorus couchianus]
MSTPPNATKRRTDILQLERDAPEDVEPSSTAVNTDPNDNWGTEPNFNLNFNLSSTTSPRPTKEPSKMHSGSKKEDKNKGGAAADFNTISVPSEKPRSKIPTATAQMTVKNKVGQQPKSPNIKLSSSPKVQSHGNLALSPKPTGVELRSSQRSTEKVRIETPKAESVKPVTPELTTNSANSIKPTEKTQSNSKDVKDVHLETPPKTLQLPKIPKVHNQKGDKSSKSPKLTNRTPTMMAKIKKSDSVNSTTDQTPENDSGAQGVFTTAGTSQKEKTGSPLLRTKPSRVTSLSPKPATQRKTTGTGTINVSRSEGNLHSKDVKVKTSSTPKSTKRSKDSLDSKLSSRSRDALDSRSSSASKSSLDSRDSLDSKKLQSSKLIQNPHDPKTSAETRMKKSHQGSEKDFKTVPKNNHDSKLLQNSKASFDPKIKTNSGSDSKPGITQSRSPATLQASAFSMDLLGCGSISPISSGTIKTSGSAVELSLNHSQSDSSSSGQVLPGSKSTLADLSSPISATQSPGSSTGKSFTSTLTGSNKENKKSPSSTPGILAPLASSSPKTRPVVTSKILEGSTDTAEDPAVMKKDPNSSSRNTSLTRGLTFDSITKPGSNTNKAKNDRDGRPSGDSEGRSVLPLSKAGHPGDTNIISSPRATRTREPKHKIQVHGKKNEGNPSSPLRPISSSSTHTPTKKKVKETAPKPELSQRLHKRAGAQKEVGVQVEVDVVECSASTSPSLHRGPPISSMIGSSSCQSSLSDVPPLKHVCQIEIELCSQTLFPCVVPDKASSLPACLRFQQNPGLMSGFGPHHNPDVGAESLWEDETKEEQWQPNKKQEDGFKGQTEKPPEVLWDKQGMTWEVYGASVDLESLGTAIQSHLEMKIREQERHIRILRKSICSNSSFARYKRKKRRRRFLGCCIKASAVSD